MNRSGGAIETGDALSAASADARVPIAAEPILPQHSFPLRIMHVVDRLHLGGTEKVMMKLLNGLDADLFQQSVCTLRGTAPLARSWVCEVQIRDAGDGAAHFQFNVLRLAKIMKQIRPMIVHSRNWGGIEAVVAGRMVNVPVIIHSEHGYELDMLSGLPLRQRIFRQLAYRCATAVFTVSQELRRYHAAQAWWSPDHIQVLHNGVDGEKFKPSTEMRAQARQQLGIPRDALVIGFVGRMIPLKDLITLLRAVDKLVSTVPQVQVLLVGSGPELPRLKAYVAASQQLHGRVHFPGTSETVNVMLNAMDIFVLPSLMEGMSNTLLEAMATGLPVIATEVGGNPEILDNSVSGYLFEPRNAGQLSEKLTTLLISREHRAQFSKAARKRALTHFSLEAMLRRYRNLYLELAMRRGIIQRRTNYVRN